MIADMPNAQSAKFLAGRLCLDFVNTKSGRGTPTERDRLGTYDDLLAWCMRAQVLNGGEAADLERQASRDAGAAGDAFRCACRLRDALHGIFANIAHGRSVPDSDLAVMNGALADALRHGAIAERDGAFGWRWRRDSLDSMLWPIAHSAAELLMSDLRLRIGECGGVACGWLFLDETRNRSRRWCEMEVCGNRAKARRHYHRHHAAPSGG